MATVKVKFRPSATEGKEGSMYYQEIHQRVARQVKTGYRMYESEWDESRSEVIISGSDAVRREYLSRLKDSIQDDVRKFGRIIASLERYGRPYSSDEVVSAFIADNPHDTLFGFMEEVISGLIKMGKVRSSETYTTTLRSFCRFREYVDISLEKVDSDLMRAYEAWLRAGGVSPNGSAFYMRNLRAVYNRAVEKELTPQRYPFKHVYTGVDKTVKRAVPITIIRKLRDMDLSDDPQADFARNMFMFSFYTRGMSLVDISYLRKKDLQNGILTYRRKKTGQQLFIKWEKPMQEIIDKYDTTDSIYLLPIIKPNSKFEERRQYIYAGNLINRSLKAIGRELGLSVPFTMYVARHSWASIAKSKNIPLSVISEGMGHDSENTTRIYLAQLDTAAIDKANKMILKSL